MRLELEKGKPVESVSEAGLRSALRRLRSYRPPSFAILAKAEGEFIQVGGGGQTCVVEKRCGLNGPCFRAYKDQDHSVFADGTILSFSGNRIALLANEWFSVTDVEEIFVRYLLGIEEPDFVRWRDISDILGSG